MAYKALYRSYRPTNFGEVIGQRHVIQTLKNALKEDKTSHAYVFCGLRGIGKTTIARILAKAVNCLDLKNGEPCNECANCKAINENSTTDIIELDAASNNGVDEIRGILDRVNFLPSVLKRKVYIIDEVHMLSSAAFNALLKTLEEPPAYVMFILATTEPHKIPTTILSRCQRFDFKQLTLEELTVELEIICEKEGIKITDEAVGKIAEAAEGGMRDALSILDQASVYAADEVSSDDVDAVTGNVSNNKLISLIKAFNNDDATGAIDIVNELLNSGKEVSRLITCIIQFCRDLLLFKSVDTEKFNKTIYKNPEFKELAEGTDPKRLFYYIDVLVDVQNKIRFTNSQKIYLEVGLMKIINQTSQDIDILGKIQSIEERLDNGNISTGEMAGSNATYDQKLMILDNKVKKLSSDIERMDVRGFKESINSKINMLEEVSTNSTLVPSLENRILEIENKLNSYEDAQTNDTATPNIQNVEPVVQNVQTFDPSDIYSIIEEKENSLRIEINNLKNSYIYNKEKSDSLPSDSSELEERLNHLESLIDELIMDKGSKEPDIFADEPNDSDIQNQINELKQQISLLQNNVSENPESTENRFPTKRVNPYLVSNEEEQQSDTNDLEQKYNQLATEIETLKALGNVENIKELENRINSLESRVQGSSNETMSKSLEELKVNYFLLSQTVAHLGTKGIDNVVNERVEKLEEEIKELNNRLQEVKDTRKEVQVIEKEAIQEVKKPIEEAPVKEEPKNEPIVEENKEEIIEPVVQTPNVVETIKHEEDITNKVYDVKILEQTLNEAFDKSNREEKDRVVKTWEKLGERISGTLASVARLLSEGTVKACGKARLIISFPVVQMCNDLMSPKRHKEACEALRIALGKEYEFLALPEETWMEKREEYSNQLRIGIKSPTLTPFNNPSLKVIDVEREPSISKREESLSKAKEFFKDE